MGAHCLNSRLEINPDNNLYEVLSSQEHRYDLSMEKFLSRKF